MNTRRLPSGCGTPRKREEECFGRCPWRAPWPLSFRQGSVSLPPFPPSPLHALSVLPCRLTRDDGAWGQPFSCHLPASRAAASGQGAGAPRGLAQGRDALEGRDATSVARDVCAAVVHARGAAGTLCVVVWLVQVWVWVWVWVWVDVCVWMCMCACVCLGGDGSDGSGRAAATAAEGSWQQPDLLCLLFRGQVYSDGLRLLNIFQEITK